MKGTRLLTGFLKKFLIVANKPFMAQKMVHPHNSGSAVRIFKKFFTIKGASRYMKIMFLIFSKKENCFGAKGPFWIQRWCVLMTLELLEEFF